MRLSQLRKLALAQEFNFARVTRVHSSLYRLASDIPETGSAKYFDSMSSVLLYATIPSALIGISVIGTTKQYDFYKIREFNVCKAWILSDPFCAVI